MADTFQNFQAGLTAPAEHAALTSGDDANDLASVSRGISFGTAGALKVTTSAGDTLIIPSGALAAGIVHPLRVRRVWATNTTAGSIVVYW